MTRPACLALALGLLACVACSGSLPRQPAQAEPFGAAPAPACPRPASWPYWALLGGVALGLLAAWGVRRLRRRRLERALRQLGGAAAPADLARLRAALAVLEEVAQAWRSRGKVVRLKDWRGRKKKKGSSGQWLDEEEGW